jgi:hypothetical protein
MLTSTIVGEFSSRNARKVIIFVDVNQISSSTSSFQISTRNIQHVHIE